jgi:hypothetical protein
VKGWRRKMKNRKEWRQIVQEAKAVAPRGTKELNMYELRGKTNFAMKYPEQLHWTPVGKLLKQEISDDV